MDRIANPPLEIQLQFADGDYYFRLPTRLVDELQRKCGVVVQHPQYGQMTLPTGVGAIVNRVLRGRYRLRDGEAFGEPLEADFHHNDLWWTIRLALIGGGRGEVDGQEVLVNPIRADELMATYVEPMPWGERWTLAAAILQACMQGYRAPDDAQKKAAPPKKARPARSKKGGSTSPAVSPTVQ